MRALVTGGSAGLGKAFCDVLLQNGYEVTNVDRNPAPNDSNLVHIACDLSDRKTVDKLIEKIGKGEPFDIVIFNAGISATGKFEEIEPASHARVVEINATAPMAICAAMMQAEKVAKNGHIAFISSLSHFAGYPGASSYAASKDALAVYAKSIRKAFKKSHGITVTTAYPGPLKTDHAERHAPEGADAEKRMTPEDAANLIMSDIRKGSVSALPGTAAKIVALIGRIAPKPLTLVMRAIIYRKLDKTVAD
ncbi:MAG: SDR family oxidoreductase [Pseudomonadota bacterium]